MKIRRYPGNQWQADAGLINGIRLRKVFGSKRDAENWLDDRRQDRLNLQLGLSVLSPACTADATAALEMLAGRATLCQAARFWRDQHHDSGIAFLLALNQFAEHLRLRDARESYRKGILETLKRFRAEFGDFSVHAYGSERILEWLKQFTDKTTFANRRRELSVFFNWCVKQNYLSLNPVARIPSPKLEDRRIEVLEPVKVLKILQSTVGSERAYFAIGFFAGLRPTEIRRLYWSDVHLKEGYIEVGADQSKERRRRLPPILPNLHEWLVPLFGPMEKPICRINQTLMHQRACAAAGLTRWPRDVARHSFASYRLAVSTMDQTAQELGHSTTAMLFTHYRAVVTREAAEAYWTIRPN